MAWYRNAETERSKSDEAAYYQRQGHLMPASIVLGR